MRLMLACLIACAAKPKPVVEEAMVPAEQGPSGPTMMVEQVAGPTGPTSWDFLVLVEADRVSSYRFDPIGLAKVASVTVDIGYVAAAHGNRIVVGGGDKVQLVSIAPTGGLAARDSTTIAGGNVTFVAFHPSGAHVYVSDGRTAPDGAVHVYALGESGLTETSSVTGMAFPHGVAVTQDRLYTADYAGGLGTGDQISAFFIGSDGALTPMVDSPYHAGNEHLNDPRNLTVAGNHLYVVDESSAPTRMCRFDVDGAGGLTGPVSAAVIEGTAGAAIASDGTLTFATTRTGHAVDVFIDAQYVNAGQTGDNPVVLALHENKVFVATAEGVKGFAYGPTGALDPLTPMGGTGPINFVLVARPR